jgi:hypothetical protein
LISENDNLNSREERLERRDRAADMRNLRVWDGKHIEVKLKEIIPQVFDLVNREH